jgi:TPR repeat protein
MMQPAGRLLIAAILCLPWILPAMADPYDDGWAAYHRRSYAEAIAIWRPLAEQGDARAQVALGEMYQWAYGVPQDDAEAVRWYRRAAEQGRVDAQRLLGTIYYEGLGVLQSTPDAAFWLEKAAEQGSGNGQLELARIYRDGYGVPRNLVQAYVWFELAARQGIFGAAEGRDETARQMSPTEIDKARRLADAWKPSSAP